MKAETLPSVSQAFYAKEQRAIPRLILKYEMDLLKNGKIITASGVEITPIAQNLYLVTVTSLTGHPVKTSLVMIDSLYEG